MERVYQVLRIALWCFLGVYIGSSLYQYYDYATHPELYSMPSAPWYTGIFIRGIFTAVMTVILLIAMRVVKKRIS